MSIWYAAMTSSSCCSRRPSIAATLQPGYIKGYVPGIRENGGQYTHAAAWVVQATAMLGQGTRAMEFFDMLNPITHTSSPEALARYRVEPYVVAADLYSQPPHVGRGGWTWYTGSAAWLYRVAVETILGFHLEGNRFRISPCIPSRWPDLRNHLPLPVGDLRHQGGESKRDRTWPRERTSGQPALHQSLIDLTDDGLIHQVRVVLG